MNRRTIAAFASGLALGLAAVGPAPAPGPGSRPAAPQQAAAPQQDAGTQQHGTEQDGGAGSRAPRQDRAALERERAARVLADRVLYGEGGKKALVEAWRARIAELAELDELGEEELFFLGCVQLMRDVGVAIGGRSGGGIRLVGALELALESFEPGAGEWAVRSALSGRVPDGHPLAGVDPASLVVPKGRFVKYLTPGGVLGADADPSQLDGLDEYAVLIGMGERALLVYPNHRRPIDPWVVWLPARTVPPGWDRPVLPLGVHR